MAEEAAGRGLPSPGASPHVGPTNVTSPEAFRSPAFSPWHGPSTVGKSESSLPFELLPPTALPVIDQPAYWWPHQATMYDESQYAMTADGVPQYSDFGWMQPEYYLGYDAMNPQDSAQYGWAPAPGTWDEMQIFPEQQVPSDCTDPMKSLQQPCIEEVGDCQHVKKPGQTACAGLQGKVSGSSNEDIRTTVMIRNLPAGFTRDMLIELMDSEGFRFRYDFAYLPVDFGSGMSLGYGFINLLNNEDALEFFEHFNGFSGWQCGSQSICSVSWGEPCQGLEAHVERYRNSPVMHGSVPDTWKPLLFVRGEAVGFPAPTKRVKAPKIRSRQHKA